jgi:hypothetical protein
MQPPPRRAPSASAELLLAGGEHDPHLDRLADRLRLRGLAFRELRVGRTACPRLTVDLLPGPLRLDGEPLDPSAVLLRHDVFSWLRDPRAAVSDRASAWWQAIAGWLLINQHIPCYNRTYLRSRTHKLHALARAHAHGLPVAETVVSNDPSAWTEPEQRVAKPISGGGYCLALPDALRDAELDDGALPSPAIVQRRLGPPEVRVYLIGARVFSFEVRSEHLDYRDDPRSTVHLHEGLPTASLHALRNLADELGLDCAAADFKTSPHSGDLCFLEINAQPMWEAYDQLTDGAIADALIDGLRAPLRSPPPSECPVDR